MKTLLVYPEIPPTFWSFKNALKFISKKSAEPPLGIITVASMLPKEWELRLVDMNVSKLKEKDILWADYVFISGMNIQAVSFREVIRKCNRLGVKVVAGGPFATTQYNDFLGIDHFVLNEAEITFPLFLNDLQNGKPKRLYRTDEFPDISNSPVPRWDLLERNKYASMSIQYSRGCPYDCEFCSITMLNGRKPRTKSTEQFLHELDVLLNLGWKGGISIVDDNFIGNKRKLKNEVLPALINWQREKKYPFKFITEVSINLADDEKLMQLMIQAGIDNVFVGIESPNSSSLEECGKNQNLKRNLIDSIKTLQRHGFIVSGGFIIGFDHDRKEIFDEQINFIQQSGIVSAMVGLLNAPTGTKLFKRLKSENRLVDNFSGNNMDGTMNFIPAMKYGELIRGYHKILQSIYNHKSFYERIRKFIKEYKMPEWKSTVPNLSETKAFIKLIWKIGLLDKGKRYFWSTLFYSLFRCPKKFSLAMTLAVYGYHYRKVTGSI